MQRLFILLFAVVTLACQSKKTDENTGEQPVQLIPVPYRLDQPSQRFTLPFELREVSGLAYFKPGRLLCIQDETAVAYIFDTKRQQVADSSVFGAYGDYEGVEWTGEEIFALKSNGDLYHFKPFSTQIARIPTDLPEKTEVEGLAFDPEMKRLLIAVKEEKKKDRKVIYMYDLSRKVVWRGLTIPDQILKDAGIKAERFKPSGIAVHPKTGDMYLISAADKRLLVLGRTGKVIATAPLDPQLFRQPEGVCFAPDGTLYLASEGDGQAGYILEFKPAADL